MKQRRNRLSTGAVLLAGAMVVPQRVAEPPTPAVGVAPHSVRYERVLAPVVARAGGHDEEAGRGFVVHLDAEGRPFVPEPGSVGALPEAGDGRASGEASLEVVDAPGGGKMVVTDRRFDLYSTARLDGEGRVAGACGRAGSSESAGR